MSILEATSSQFASSEAKYSLNAAESLLVADPSAPGHHLHHLHHQQHVHHPQHHQHHQQPRYQQLPNGQFVVFGTSNPSSPTSTNIQNPLPNNPSVGSDLNSLHAPSTLSSPRQAPTPSTDQIVARPGSGKISHPAFTTAPFHKPTITVPPYISDNAYYLFYELGYTLEQVQEALLADGNSDAIVVAALAELQQ
jgi:hypothetical protein